MKVQLVNFKQAHSSQHVPSQQRIGSVTVNLTAKGSQATVGTVLPLSWHSIVQVHRFGK